MGLLPEIKSRESVLVFKDKSVEEGKVKDLMNAARWAPSCFNNQPWNYVFVREHDDSREGVEGALSTGNGWAEKAPLIIVVGAKPSDSCDTNDLPYYMYDCGLSVMNMVVQAEHLGLKAHQMAGWDEEGVREAVGFPDDYRVVVVFTIGYEGSVEKLSDKLLKLVKDKLSRPRTRKDLSENFFFNQFGEKR